MSKADLSSVFRLLAKNPKTSMLLAVIALIVYSCKPDKDLYQGVPKATSWSPYTWTHVLHNHGFVVGYSDLRGNPLWVEYALSPIDESKPSLPRPSRFQTDSRVFNRIKHDDYTKSGYDRGHNAPNYAMSYLYGAEGQKDSFLMTNISPQLPKLNRQFWQRLESVEAKHFTEFSDNKVWVITGPVFTGSTERLSSSWKVEIPDAFYKMYITEPKDRKKPLQVLAFLVPQNVKGNESLSDFVTTIDEIEKQTGFDFFNDLDDNIEDKLETSKTPEEWDLQFVNNTPSIYH